MINFLMTMHQLTIAISQTGAVKAPALTAESSWGDVFGFLCLGIFIVLSALAGLSILCAVIGFFFKRVEEAKQNREEVKKPRETAPSADDGFPHLPVIAATVAVVLDNHHYRITRITPAHSLNELNPWAREGRRQIFNAHTRMRRH